jgi:hypothetical protein
MSSPPGSHRPSPIWVGDSLSWEATHSPATGITVHTATLPTTISAISEVAAIGRAIPSTS